MSLDQNKRDWEEIAVLDPLWAILSDPEKEHGKWDLDEFFQTGEFDVARVMAEAERLRLPKRHDRALDFGCGYGRLTRAISDHFASTVGVDISQEMVDAARRLNESYPSVEFVANDASDLSAFADEEFDFVYSYIVLQHVPSTDMIMRYIRDFVRVLRAEGLLVFQLPAALPFRYRLQPRRRAYALLRRLGVSPHYLRSSLNLHPIRMTAVPESQVVRAIEDAGGRVLVVDRAEIEGFAIPSNTYWVTRE